MYYLNYMLDLENNFLIGGITLGVVIVLCGGLAALAIILKKPLMNTIGAIVAGVLTLVTTLLAYNVLLMIAFLISVAAFAYFLTRVCQEYHKNSIYSVPFLRLYFRMFFPSYIATMLFRPWFTELEDTAASILPGLGMNNTGTYVYDVTVINEGATGTVWNIISVVEILLFLLVLIMQVLLIWRNFLDPDNAPTWATFGMIVTGIGGMFIYGVYTSPNFHIATFTLIEQVEKLNFSTGEFETTTTFTPWPSTLDHLTTAPFVLILGGVANRLFYMDKRKKAK